MHHGNKVTCHAFYHYSPVYRSYIDITLYCYYIISFTPTTTNHVGLPHRHHHNAIHQHLNHSTPSSSIKIDSSTMIANTKKPTTIVDPSTTYAAALIRTQDSQKMKWGHRHTVFNCSACSLLRECRYRPIHVGTFWCSLCVIR